MVTPVLSAGWKGGAERLLAELEKRAISVRPFFYPCTELPIYAHCRREATPVAHELHERGLNLPCGAELSREEIHYICAHLRNILTGEEDSDPVTGWLSRRERFLRAKEDFPNVEFLDPDFQAMDCEIRLPEGEAPAAGLLESIHRSLGFRRLFLRQTLGRKESERLLMELGFTEHQRIPCIGMDGYGQMELFRQTYRDVCAYEVVYVKTF